MGFVKQMFSQRYTDALCMLALHGDLGKVRDFFDENIDVNMFYSEFPSPPIVFAAQEGKVDIVRFFVDKGAKHINLALAAAKNNKHIYSSGKIHVADDDRKQMIKRLDEVIEYLKNYLYRDLE